MELTQLTEQYSNQGEKANQMETLIHLYYMYHDEHKYTIFFNRKHSIQQVSSEKIIRTPFKIVKKKSERKRTEDDIDDSIPFDDVENIAGNLLILFYFFIFSFVIYLSEFEIS